MRFARVARISAAFAVLTLASLSAGAAPTFKEKAEARALTAEAKAAAQQERFEDAVKALRRADGLDPTDQRKLDLARALVGAGKLVEASTVLHGLADAPARSFGAKKVQAAAKKLLGRLEKRIPWIQVAVTGPDEGAASTTVDGEEVDASIEMPIDPGEHVIVAEAEGFERAEERVKIDEGAHEIVRITLRRSAPPPEPAAEAPSGGSKVPAAIAFGVGAVGLGVGAVFGLLAFDETSTAKESCNGNVCPNKPEIVAARDAAVRNGNISTIGFIAGGVGVAAGVVLLLVSPGSSAPASTDDEASIQPWIGAGQAGVTGAF